MTTEQEMKAWIDQASYEDLLRKWRFAEVGSPWFAGEVGEYYKEMMGKRRQAEMVAETLMTGDVPDVHVRASKRIGWDKP